MLVKFDAEHYRHLLSNASFPVFLNTSVFLKLVVAIPLLLAIQSSNLRNVERILEKSGGELEELGTYLSDLATFPTFLFGDGKFCTFLVSMMS